VGTGQTRGIEHILDKWRGLIKSKKRMIISLEEIIQAKIESLRPWIIEDREPLSGWQHRHFRYDRHSERTWMDDEWRPIAVGDTWGGTDMSCYFRLDGARIPERFKGRQVALRAYFSGDGLLRVNGKAYHGMDPFRDLVTMTGCAIGGESYDLEVESYIAWHFGEGTVKTMEVSEWVVRDPEIDEAYWDLKAAFNLLMTEGLPGDLTAHLRDVLHSVTKPIQQECPEREQVKQMALRAQQTVRERIYACDRFKRTGLLHLCGNSHLDLVYLWTHAEYDRKIGRTHSTALRMMEHYPEYIFSQSQPQMYDRMRTLYPELYEQVKARIAEGRWEAIGAFWVEPDCNLISGESMVRQLVHGIRFYQREFGVTPSTAWIPDVFGNAWSMPQIMVKAGLKYFVTHKMNVWNDTNKWTRHVFWWEGPDGSRIFATVPPTHFIGVCEPDHMNDHWDQYSAKAQVPESLYCYGWGDGGGGPDREMLEYCRRYCDMPGMVPARFSKIEDALERMRRLATEHDDIPLINDELYLEEHRGVYTTKGRLKKLNRRLEYLLRDAEMFSVFAGVDFPHDALDAAWKLLLTTQFHDSLPGTHVREAYFELLDMLGECEAKAGGALEAACRSFGGAPLSSIDTDKTLLLFNGEPHERTRLAEVPCTLEQAHVLGPDGAEIPSQFGTAFEHGERVLVFMARVPACGFATYQVVEGAGMGDWPAVTLDGTTLENDYLRVAFDAQGELVSLYDKAAQRECIDAEQRGNVFQLFEDMPGTFDAWDIEMHYEDTEFELAPGTVEAGEQGPLLSSLIIRKQIMGSPLVQRVRLARDARRVEFETSIDWKERHKLLKVRFHTTVRSRHATYDIAYANIERPTTRNNSYEEAKFEVPGHEWMDLSQPEFGLSLLTDSKYGYECRDARMGLSLLKGPMYPDPESDIEMHHFTYALQPHAGTWREAGTIEAARDLNVPFHVRVADAGDDGVSAARSFLAVDEPGVSLEAVKRAEDGSGDIVVRLVERQGRNVSVMLSCLGETTAAHECDLLEEAQQSLVTESGMILLPFAPYEIKTVRLKGAKA